MIDIEKNIIMDVEGSPSTNRLEALTTRTMIERIESKHSIIPERLMGDTTYGIAENLAFLVEEKNIEPHIPVWDKTQRKNNTFLRVISNEVLRKINIVARKEKHYGPGVEKQHSTTTVTKANTINRDTLGYRTVLANNLLFMQALIHRWKRSALHADNVYSWL